MIRTIIVDDELRSRHTLANLINKYCEGIDIIGEAEDIEGAISSIQEKKPQLLFLDIRLREGTSFEILRRLTPNNYSIIFTTAYDEYAIKAFKFNAMDYLLKPIDLEELKSAVKKAKNHIQSYHRKENIKVNHLLSFNSNDPTLTVTTEQSIEFLRVFDIMRLESEGSYTRIYMNNGEAILASKHLKVFEDILAEYQFFRSHNSHLVNLQKVVRLHKTDGMILELNDGSKVPLSRRKKESFLKMK
jgi:two-component system LytT family response regulator